MKYLLILFLFLAGCAPAPKATEAVKPGTVECADPRPQMCTRQYQPVCAERDTGVRCIQAPCTEASEWKTYGNACDACADPKVYRHYPGECDQASTPPAE